MLFITKLQWLVRGPRGIYFEIPFEVFIPFFLNANKSTAKKVSTKIYVRQENIIMLAACYQWLI